MSIKNDIYLINHRRISLPNNSKAQNSVPDATYRRDLLRLLHATIKLAPNSSRLLIGIIQLGRIKDELVLKLLDAKYTLEHIIQLLLCHRALRRAIRIQVVARVPPASYALGTAHRVLIVAVNEVELAHPAIQHRLLTQAIDLGQTSHPLLNVVLEHVTEVRGGAGARLHHLGNALRLEEHLLRYISISIQLTSPNSLNTQSTPIISIPNDNNILSPLTT